MNQQTGSSAAIIQTFLPRRRRRALLNGEALPKKEAGFCLFADISGFTPLTESLRNSLGPQQGAEVLTAVINSVFEALITQVHRYGGDVMGFAGDAILCWFPQALSETVLPCAQSMQAEMAQFTAVATPDGASHTLQMKVGLAQGLVQRLLVGDPEYGHFEVLTGTTIARMADAEHHADKGEIICAPEIVSAVGTAASWGEDREGFCPILSLNTEVDTLPPEEDLADLTLDAVRPYFPPLLFKWLSGAQSSLLAELRPVVSAFIRFTGLDYENDPQVEEKLDRYVRVIQQLATHYGGSMILLDYGGKGSVAHVVFGAPIAHEDDEIRAVGWALALQEAGQEFPFISGQQIGMTKGQVYAGALGASTRRVYTLMGDEVNASARLMQACQPGQILVSQNIMLAAQKQYMFHQFPGFQVKGKYEPIPVAMPTAPLPPMPQLVPSGPLVGRDEEMARLNQALDTVMTGDGRILRIEGQAGVGKSRLVAELVQTAISRGMRTLVGSGQSVGQDTPYLAWREICRVLFGLQSGWPAAQQAMQIENVVRWINPDWLIRVPLFGDILGIDIPDNPTTAAFDPHLRQQSLSALLGDLLARMAKQQPLLILIEDGHWIDQSSAELVENLALSLSRAHVLLTVTQRPPLDPDQPILPGLNARDHYIHLDLNELSPEAVHIVVTSRLGGELPPDLMAIIEERAQGNPFFVEELAETIRETTHLERVEGRWVLAGSVSGPPELPATIQGVVLARLDRLDEGSKLTIKVSSVVGRQFEVETVKHIHPEQPLQEVLFGQLDTLERRDIIFEDLPEPHPAYQFKHNTTQEVAYATLLYTQRRLLHRAVAEWYEQGFERGAIDSLSPYYPLLVHHYHQAEEPKHERDYARLAGEQAARKCANEEAVTYLSRALELTPGDEECAQERYALLLVRERVYDTMGVREAQQQDLLTLEELAGLLDEDQKRAQVALRWANYAEATGDFAGVVEVAQEAIRWAQAAQDVEKHAAGHLQWGRGLHRQGELDAAQTQIEQALDQSRSASLHQQEAESLQSLGWVHIFQGDYDNARVSYEQALHIYRDLGDRLGESKAINGLGMVCGRLADIETAQAHYQQSLQICREIGDRRGTSMLLGNLGVMAERQGNYTEAEKHYAQALDLFCKIGEKRSESMVLGNLGILFLYQGDYARARDYVESALQLYQEINAQGSVAQVLSNLGLLFHHVGNDKAARDRSQRAIQIAQQVGARSTEAEALTHLGHALVGLAQLAEAGEVYRRAVTIRRDLGEQILVIESLAGLARISLEQNDPDQALSTVEEILDHLEDNRLDGAEEPLRIYLTGYRVLRATGNPRAQELLTTAYNLLQEQAAKIDDEEMRRSFLENVAAHREIVREYGK